MQKANPLNRSYYGGALQFLIKQRKPLEVKDVAT